MKKIFILVLFITTITNLTIAQTKNTSELSNVSITWELLENKPPKARQSSKDYLCLVQLTIQNNSKTETLPASGWELYFNHPREVSEVISGDVTFQYLGGDYSKMQPAQNFRPLLPGQQIKIQYITKRHLFNKSDAPSGFYFVSDNKTAVVKNYTAKPILNSGLRDLTPAELYARYSEAEHLPADKVGGVFPTPVSAAYKEGEITLTGNFKIIADDFFANEAKLLSEDFETVFGKKAIVQKTYDAHNTIVFKQVQGLTQEGYELEITRSGIEIKATSLAGAFYAVKSLTNLFPLTAWEGRSKPFVLKAQSIKDSPRFPYRAFLLDVARNFHSKAQVKKVIDLMANYKLNTLHFHLNDDEGWRLEIPSLPELTEVGSKRAHIFTNANLMPSYGSGPTIDNTSGTGHYTRADFIELLKYAKARHIEVIPEIETPGHARAAIKAMLYRYQKYMSLGNKRAAEEYLLTDLEDKSIYKSVQGFNDNIMNVALPSTYRFLEKVVDEITDAYKEAGARLTTVHIGGDEVPSGAWQKSKAVNQLIADKTISNTDDLWYYYLGKVHKLLEKRNLQLAGWEEIALRKTQLDGKSKYIVNSNFVNNNFRVYVWNTAWGKGSEDLAYQLANAGYKTVLAPVTNFYFDLAYSKDHDEPGLYWGGYVDTDKPFYFVPFDYYKTAKEDYLGNPVKKELLAHKERLTDFGKSNIVGIQCLLWSEKVTSATQLEYMLFPKLLGFAERAWSKSPDWAEEKNEVKSEQQYREAWSVFANIMGKRELPKLDEYKGGVNYRIPPAGVLVKENKVFANTQFPGLQVRYTTDGKEPTFNSKLYENPIPFQKGLKFKTFNAKGRSSEITSLEE